MAPLIRKNVFGAVFAVFLVAGAVAVMLVLPEWRNTLGNFGLDSSWRCKASLAGEQVCVKR